MDVMASQNAQDALYAALLMPNGTARFIAASTLSNLSIASALTRVEKKTMTEVVPIRSKLLAAAPSLAINRENSPTEIIASPENAACLDVKPNR